MIVMVNEQQVEVDDQTTVAALLEFTGLSGAGCRRSVGSGGLTPIRLDDKAY